jgi:hypothetical protein
VNPSRGTLVLALEALIRLVRREYGEGPLSEAARIHGSDPMRPGVPLTPAHYAALEDVELLIDGESRPGGSEDGF